MDSNHTSAPHGAAEELYASFPRYVASNISHSFKSLDETTKIWNVQITCTRRFALASGMPECWMDNVIRHPKQTWGKRLVCGKDTWVKLHYVVRTDRLYLECSGYIGKAEMPKWMVALEEARRTALRDYEEHCDHGGGSTAGASPEKCSELLHASARKRTDEGYLRFLSRAAGLDEETA